MSRCCLNCHASLGGDAQFCRECGTAAPVSGDSRADAAPPADARDMPPTLYFNRLLRPPTLNNSVNGAAPSPMNPFTVELRFHNPHPIDFLKVDADYNKPAVEPFLHYLGGLNSFRLRQGEKRALYLNFDARRESPSVPLELLIAVARNDGEVYVYRTEDPVRIPIMSQTSYAGPTQISYTINQNIDNKQGVMDNSGGDPRVDSAVEAFWRPAAPPSSAPLAADPEWAPLSLVLDIDETAKAQARVKAEAEISRLETTLFKADRARLETMGPGAKRCLYLASGRRIVFGRPPDQADMEKADIWLWWDGVIGNEDNIWRAKHVSRMEFELLQDNHQMSVRRAKGGALINGKPMPVPADNWRPLREGDRIAVGCNGCHMPPLEVGFCREDGAAGGAIACCWLRPAETLSTETMPWAVECLVLRARADLDRCSCPGLLPDCPPGAARIHRDRGAYWLERASAKVEVSLNGEMAPAGQWLPLPEEAEIAINGAHLLWRAFAPRGW